MRYEKNKIDNNWTNLFSDYINAQESFKTDTFSFSFEGKRLHGFIDIP